MRDAGQPVPAALSQLANLASVTTFPVLAPPLAEQPEGKAALVPAQASENPLSNVTFLQELQAAIVRRPVLENSILRRTQHTVDLQAQIDLLRMEMEAANGANAREQAELEDLILILDSPEVAEVAAALKNLSNLFVS